MHGRAHRGYRHDGARAVGHQHIVSDPDRDGLPVDRIDCIRTGELAGLLLVGRELAVHIGAVLGRSDIGIDRALARIGRDLADQRVLGCEHAVGGAEEGVGPSGEDHKALLAIGDLEADLGSLGATDPVPLHLQDAFGPVQTVQIIEQALCIGGDPEHPLAHHLALDRVTGLDILSVLDLLIGEHGALGWAPVDWDLGQVGQALLVQLQEDPLGPAVVLGVGGVDLAVP